MNSTEMTGTDKALAAWFVAAYRMAWEAYWGDVVSFLAASDELDRMREEHG